MIEQLQNMWQAARGVMILLIAAIVLICIVGIMMLLVFWQPNTDTALTPPEKAYPQATPQPFRHQEEKDVGTLVVTSNIPDVTVLLEAEEHPSPEDPIPRGQKWPHNTTPFRVERIPVGEHVLFAIKPPSYDMATIVFEIMKDKVTRVHIELIPLRTNN
jgi:hypothetical protein